MRAQNYKHTLIMTASPMELILMLYDEAIKSLGQALSAFKIEGPDRIQEINNNIVHAQDIITELVVSLDMEKGGEVSVNLHRLYDFMLSHLTEANVNKASRQVDTVLGLMQELRDAWRQVAANEPNRNGDIPPANQTKGIIIAG